MENGDKVQYKYLGAEAWENAVYVSESRLLYDLLDDDGIFRSYYKHRIELRKADNSFDEICHMCGGSGKDEDTERAASFGRCSNCHGTGKEPNDFLEEMVTP